VVSQELLIKRMAMKTLKDPRTPPLSQVRILKQARR